MKCYIGLGSNVGEKLANLERAAQALRSLSTDGFRASPVYESAALVPERAPESWHAPFLNAVAEIDWDGTPAELLKKLKDIESQLGRTPAERWAPRIIDLDILLFGNETVKQENLIIPHPGIWERSFVLNPLKDLIPTFQIPGRIQTILSRARELPTRNPLWMGIINLTPDSFSDGGSISDNSHLLDKVEAFEAAKVGILDIGAESTRPGATAVNPDDEWKRLGPTLEFLTDRYRYLIFRPRISVDTRHAAVAAKAAELKVDYINDVSGGSKEMYEVIKHTKIEYILMHSLTVPADSQVNLPPETDPVSYLKIWCEEKLRTLDKAGVNLDRIIFDPGVGFGKTSAQTFTLLGRIDELLDLPVRILIGHSRKSFLKHLINTDAKDRDLESIGISLQLANSGVDILRVHEPQFHIRTYRAFQEVASWNH
ncbi:MAG: dihydropteroate synthase [Bdellovibrionota bacterium]